MALTHHSTLVGSEEDWENVGTSVNWLKSQGLDPQVVTYYPYISTLNEITLEMVAPTYRTQDQRGSVAMAGRLRRYRLGLQRLLACR